MATVTCYPKGYSRLTRLYIEDRNNPVGQGSSNTTYATLSYNDSTATTGYVEWPFDVSAIPENVTIDSVTCKIKIGVQNPDALQHLYAQMCYNSSPRGTKYNFKNMAGVNSISNTGSWTRSELDLISLYLEIYPIDETSIEDAVFYFYGADLIVTYTINDSSTGTPGIMIETKTFYPEEYEDATDLYGSIENPTAPVGKGSTNTTYAKIPVNAGGGYVYWPFDTSIIPVNATIDSVTCTAKGSISTSSNTSGNMQLYAGTVAKGVYTSMGTAATAVNITPGTWTRAELSNIRLRTEITYATMANRYISFYGADLTVSYTCQGQKFMLKTGGIWSDASCVFKKINGVWVEQTDLANVIENRVRYQNSREIANTKKTVTITGAGELDPGTSGTHIYCYLEIDGVQYYTATTLSVNPGTQILIHVSGANNSIIIDEEAVLDSVMGVYTQKLIVNNDCTIDLITTTYGGNVTVTTSGGSSTYIISFTIDDVEYEAEKGMTWAEWCDSDYNNNEWATWEVVSGRGITYADEWITLNDETTKVISTDVIIADYDYYTVFENWI